VDAAEILDVLHDKGVKSYVLFVIWAGGTEVSLGRANEMYAEGHEIGNHTFLRIRTSA